MNQRNNASRNDTEYLNASKANREHLERSISQIETLIGAAVSEEQVIEAAVLLFQGKRTEAEAWLDRPCVALGQPPRNLLGTPAGREAVMDVIQCLANGAFI